MLPSDFTQTVFTCFLVAASEDFIHVSWYPPWYPPLSPSPSSRSPRQRNAITLFWHDLFLINASWLLLPLQLVFIKDLCKKWVDVSAFLGVIARPMHVGVSNSFLSKQAYLQCCGLAAMPQEISEITGSERNTWFFFFHSCFKNKFPLKLMHSDVAYFCEIAFPRRNMSCHTLYP